MDVTVEISNYPFSEEFEDIILDFIHRCKASHVTVTVNATSTHLQGEYDDVMGLLQREIKHSFEKYGKMIFVLKILKGKLDLEFNM